ncbi:MAG: peptidylprolyl isomerase [Flavobacteriia bacterium]|nr:peptidylprolyl isomerase [Flavobacteriia bacterium]
MKYTILFTFFLFSFSFFSQEKNSYIIDKIVAQIGNNPILKSDIENKKIEFIQNGQKLDQITDCDILEQLLYQGLLLNQAEIDSVQITDAQVDAEMENRIRIIENQIGGREKMEQFYGKTITDIKNEFRSTIKKRMLADETERTLLSSVSVSPKEIEKFFDKIPKDSLPLISSQLSFQQIVVFPQITEQDKQLAVKKLNDIREDIISGKSFETQARIHSQDPGSSQQGGYIEASRGMMVPQFESIAFSLKPSEISTVFETDYGYHIIQLIERKGDEYKCRHILIVPEFNRESLAQSSEMMEECFKKLSDKSITWDEAVEKYSNDKNTNKNKGVITNPITGEILWSMEDLNQVDQQIYLLTDNMKVGDFSSPSFYFDFIERKQGIRIVRLMERTQPHVANLKEDYPLILRAAENQKHEEKIKQWVSSKISGAYIRIDKEYQTCTFKNSWIKNL